MSIDVDGAELSILKGARQTLQDPRLQEVQMEAVDFTEQNEISDSIIFLSSPGYCFFCISSQFQLPLVRDFQFCERRLLSKRLFQILILTKQVFSSGKIVRRRIFYFLGGQVLRILAAELLVKFRCSYLPNYSETTRELLRDSVVVLENFLPSKKF